MDNRQFHDVKKFNRHGFFHRWNIFNSMLRNRIKNTLGTSAGKSLFLPPVILNQGSQDKCSEFGSYTIRSAVTGKTYVTDRFIGDEQAFVGGTNSTEFDAATIMATGVLSGFHANDGTSDQPSAVLWCTPNNGLDLYDSIQADINLLQCPAGIASAWYIDWEGGQNGIVPFAANNQLGGHWFAGVGKTTYAMNSKQLFPESDRLAVANTWGPGASGSDLGYYYFSRQEVNAWFGNLGIGFWIYSNDRTVQILGKMSALYTKIIELLHLA